MKAGSVLKYLLRRDPEERLGCNKEQGFNQIKQHPFFNVLDWDLLESRQVMPYCWLLVLDISEVQLLWYRILLLLSR